MTTIIEVSPMSMMITSIISIVIGIAILAVPKILNYLVAFYLLFTGITGLVIILT